MKLRLAVTAGISMLTLLGGGIIATGPAQAATTSNPCVGWIDGEWGHGKCTAETWMGGGHNMTLDVVCDAWWDADVHTSAWVPSGSTVEIQGQCYSSVVSSTARWS